MLTSEVSDPIFVSIRVKNWSALKVRLVWKTQLSLVKILFFLNRLLAFATALVLVYCESSNTRELL